MGDRTRILGQAGEQRQVTIADRGGQLVMTGTGAPIALQRSGNVYVGSGSLIGGRTARPVSVELRGSQVQLVTSRESGESVAVPLQR